MVLKDQRFRHRRRHFLLIVQCRQALRPIRGASETKRSQRPPSWDDTDVAVWRRVSSSVVLVARCRVVARRRQAHAGAGARRRSSAPPASPVRHQQTIATNKRSTSAAAQRPPAAPQSAAQAAGAARAPRRSISHAHRSPQARAGQSERCHKPPQRSCLNRGAVAHHPLARAASAALSRARARIRRERVNAGAVGELHVAVCLLPGTDPVPRCARPAAT